MLGNERSLRKRTRIYCIAETSFWQDWEATIRTALKDNKGGRTRQEQDNRREIGHRQAHGYLLNITLLIVCIIFSGFFDCCSQSQLEEFSSS